MTINNSTISGNRATKGNGGGILTSCQLTINNSTISGDIASAGNGGGIYFQGAGMVNNVTLSGNSALNGGGMSGGSGGTIFQNSIVANSPSGGNCSGTRIFSNGYNLSSDGTCSGFDKAGDLNNTDPKLGRLQNNGGPTQTMALQAGSPAIDAGNPSGCTDGHGHLLKRDQRGARRPDPEDSGGCDIGAYERQTDQPSLK